MRFRGEAISELQYRSSVLKVPEKAGRDEDQKQYSLNTEEALSTFHQEGRYAGKDIWQHTGSTQAFSF